MTALSGLEERSIANISFLSAVWTMILTRITDLKAMFSLELFFAIRTSPTFPDRTDLNQTTMQPEQRIRQRRMPTSPIFRCLVHWRQPVLPSMQTIEEELTSGDIPRR